MIQFGQWDQAFGSESLNYAFKHPHQPLPLSPVNTKLFTSVTSPSTASLPETAESTWVDNDNDDDDDDDEQATGYVTHACLSDVS